MKKGLIIAVVSSLLFLVAAPVFAAGGYVGLEGAVVWLSTSSTPENAAFFPFDAKFDTGWGIGATGGYDFEKFRLELGLAYRSNDIKEITAKGGPAAGQTFPFSGSMSSTAFMVNGYYDFRMLSKAIIPYVGAGIGMANVSADWSDNFGQFVDDDDFVFAYQFIAGVAFPITKQLTIDLNYKYFATSDPSFKDTVGDSFDAEYGSSNVILGLRFNF